MGWMYKGKRQSAVRTKATKDTYSQYVLLNSIKRKGT